MVESHLPQLALRSLEAFSQVEAEDQEFRQILGHELEHHFLFVRDPAIAAVLETLYPVVQERKYT